MDSLPALEQAIEYKTQRTLSQTEGFIALPPDVAVRLTESQLRALFAGDRKGFARELAIIAQKQRSCDITDVANSCRLVVTETEQEKAVSDEHKGVSNGI